jgi:hypothetical protein
MAFSSFFKTKKPIETRRQQRDALAARLSSAEADVATAREACTASAVEGATDAELAKVEFAKRQAEDRVQSLTGALQAFDVEIAEQAAAEADAADRKVREATARELCNRADRIEKNLAPFLAAAKICQADVEAARVVVGDIGMYDVYRRLLDEMPAAHALIAAEMRGRAAETIAERAPASLPVPEAVISPLPPIPRQSIFALQNLKWRNPARPQEFELAERFSFASVPVDRAAKALDLGVAAVPDDERVAKLKYNKRGAPPHPASCHDLDTGEAPAPSGALPWDAFRRVDRGGPVKMSLAAPAVFVEPVGARSIAPPTNNEANDEN